MNRRRFVLRAPIILVIIIAIVSVGAIYANNHRHKQVQNPATILPVTPEERDAARKKAVAALAEAIRNSRELHGTYPFAIPRNETGICNGSSVHCKQVHLLDISQILSDGFIAAIPSDPLGGPGQYNSGYSIRHEPDGSISIRAPRTEGREIISLKL